MIELLSSRSDSLRFNPGALSRMFRTCRALVEDLTSDIQAGAITTPVCACGSWHRITDNPSTIPDLVALTEVYPLALQSPFEEVETIAGGIWKASDICSGNDAILRLSFRAGTVNLPLHSHNFSDRVVFVVRGSGTFEFVSDLESNELTTTHVQEGTMLMFPRGTIHSFRTPDAGLELISYHSPYIELEDAKHYTVFSHD